VKKVIKKKVVKKAKPKKLSPNQLLAKVTKTPNKYNLAQFKAGLKVEHEHVDITKGDPVKTAKIVLAHLNELPDYYTKLKKVEKK